MDKQVISYKLQKYQQKLRNNPTNYIYQQKYSYYGNMAGGTKEGFFTRLFRKSPPASAPAPAPAPAPISGMKIVKKKDIEYIYKLIKGIAKMQREILKPIKDNKADNYKEILNNVIDEKNDYSTINYLKRNYLTTITHFNYICRINNDIHGKPNTNYNTKEYVNKLKTLSGIIEEVHRNIQNGFETDIGGSKEIIIGESIKPPCIVNIPNII
jgi:hypothetical protein